jgi:hypothetical protein
VISAAQLAAHRAIGARIFGATCALKRRSASGTPATVTGYGAIPCTYKPFPTMPQQGAGETDRATVDERYLFKLDRAAFASFSVLPVEGDLLVVGSGANERTFEVLDVPEGAINIYVRVICREPGR